MGIKFEMFSDFSDRTKFDGRLPSAGYLKHIFCEYSEQCREALDKEVKKKGIERAHYDASYKIPKLLSRVRGSRMYKCLQTVLDEFGEIRLQVFTHTDGHDQMWTPFQALNRTQVAMNQKTVASACTDKPSFDRGFFMKVFDRLC